MTAHWLSFGDLPTQVWGVCWVPDGAAAGLLAVRAGAGAAALSPAAAAAEDGVWTVEGDGASLRFSPTGPSSPGHDPSGRLESSEQLCEVTGQLPIDGQTEVSCLGWHTGLDGGPELPGLGSFRHLAAWLGPDAGFSLTALRPGRARAHDADIVSAAVLDDPPPPAVVEPRLSTTYTEAGVPSRAGLELWLAAEGSEEEEAEAEGSHQYPRRAAGEAVGPGLEWSQENFELHAALVRWHSHGREGPGVYVLGRRA